MTPRIVGFIFARGGSKGLSRKNLRRLGSKPLVVRAIETAFAVDRIRRVVVSTDDPEIADVARRAGAGIPFTRPKELAEDASPEWMAWQHAIRELRAAGDPVDVAVVLPPTAPLRSAADVNCCLDCLLNGTADIVVTVREAERNPYYNMVSMKVDGSLGLVIESRAFRRQAAPRVFDMTTVAYVARADFILAAERMFDGKVGAVLVPKERAVDIDDAVDLHIAESLIDLASSAGPAKVL